MQNTAFEKKSKYLQYIVFLLLTSHNIYSIMRLFAIKRECAFKGKAAIDDKLRKGSVSSAEIRIPRRGRI